MGIADIPEYAAALRGRPNEEDMRKHLLYYPVSRVLYGLANRARLRLGIGRDVIALIFPGALYGATSVVLAYFIFLRFMENRKSAAAATAFYAFTYSVWLFSSVPETYSLTSLSINLFFCFALARKARRDWRWLCGLVFLIALSSMNDLRSFLLLLVPFYLIARTDGMKWTERLGAAAFITVGTFTIFIVGYQLYKYASGYEGFGVCAMCTWIPRYGGGYVALGRSLDLPSVCQSVLTFLVESISPLCQEHMAGSPPAVHRAHIFFACCYSALYAVLLLGGLRCIGERLSSGLRLQALACWLGVYVIYNTLYIPDAALTYSPVIVLPLLLIILPGIVGAWRRRRFGVTMMSAVVVVVMANNLVMINEARVAWQLPDRVQVPADRVYLLPGEVERMRLLVRRGVLMLPEEERNRLAELRAKPRRVLTEVDRREMDDLVNSGLERLLEGERGEALDISRRVRAVIKLATEGK